MQLHQLQPKHLLKKKKPRVGRGGKRGTTCGRGTKGQKSRAGHRIRPNKRDLLQRLPKLRGVKNKSKRYFKTFVINVEDLEKYADKNNIITPETTKGAKILGKGEPKKAFIIKGLLLSKSARKKIEKAGGKIIE